MCSLQSLNKLFQFKNISLNSLDIRNKNSHNATKEKASGEVIWQHSHYTFIEFPVQLHGLQVSRAGSE